MPQLLEPEPLDPVPCSKRNHSSEEPAPPWERRPIWCNERKPARSNEDPERPEINLKKKVGASYLAALSFNSCIMELI